jgi:hypothetical protein
VILECVACYDDRGAFLCRLDGTPLPVSRDRFLGAVDAMDFIVWLGDDVDDVRVIREKARRWSIYRHLPCCPTCDRGRVLAGYAQCEDCLDAVERDRPLFDHMAEPNRNETRSAAE